MGKNNDSRGDQATLNNTQTASPPQGLSDEKKVVLEEVNATYQELK